MQGQGISNMPGQQGPRMMHIQGTRIIQQTQVPQQGTNVGQNQLGGQTTLVQQLQAPSTGPAAPPPPPYPEPPPPYPGAGNTQTGNQVLNFSFSIKRPFEQFKCFIIFFLIFDVFSLKEKKTKKKFHYM